MILLQVGRRLVGVLLVILTVIPAYRLLATPDTGLAGRVTIELSDLNSEMLWYGALIALLAAVVLALLVQPRSLNYWLRRASHLLMVPRSGAFALGLALIAGAITLWFSLHILKGKPNLIDAMSQLLHARYLAAGKLAGPVATEGAFWHIQNTVLTSRGWISQYPPGHPLLLAVGFGIGAVWAVGPLLMVATVFFSALAAERLLSHDRATARLGSIVVAFSPFLIGLAGAYMNHITAAAFGAAAVYFALRARDGHWIWALPTGAAVAYVFATRPLTGVVIGAVIAGTIWWQGSGASIEPWRRRTILAGGATLGALPLLLLLGAYNLYFFGSPFRFGYDLALGPTAGLGFGRDPWGNQYGPLQALGYTSSDLVALSLNLLDSALPLVTVVGLYLIVARRLSTGERIIAAWALLPVVGNIFYWHHGLFMGPRMLNEAAPAWGIFAAVGAVGVARAIPEHWSLFRGGYSIRVIVIFFLFISGIAGFLLLAPQRMWGYRNFMPSTRIIVPQPDSPSLIFVHGGWTARLGMQLAASGMRLDSLEIALTQNPTCAVANFAAAYTAEQRDESHRPEDLLDFNPDPARLPPQVETSPDNFIRISIDGSLSTRCRREVEADRNGVVDVSPLIWQGDLPGLPASGALYVRDLGPAANAELIRKFPERTPMVFYTPSPDAEPELVSYEDGMAAIWGGAEAGLEIQQFPE